MSKHDELVGIYQGLLASLDIHADENGLLFYRPYDGPTGPDGLPIPQPAMLEDKDWPAPKQWVLPTREVLKESPWEEKVAFHPLCESIINTDPITMKKLKSLVNIKLNTMLGGLLLALTDFAASKDQAAAVKVGAKASKYRQLVPNIKDVSLKQMKEILKRVTMETSKRLVNIYILRGKGSLGGFQRLRTASVNFPMRAELENADRKVFGVQLSQKDQESFKALFDYILPDNDDMETYSAASDSHVGPSFQALTEAYVKVASRLNEMIQLHRKIIPEHEHLMVDLSWAENLSHVEKLGTVIPPLPGNIGEPLRSSNNGVGISDTTAAQRKPPVVNPRGSVMGEPSRSQRDPSEGASNRVAESGKKSLSELLRERREAANRPAGFSGGGSRFGRTTGFGSGNRYDEKPREPELPDWARREDFTKMTIGGEVPEDRLGGSFANRFSGLGGRGFGGAGSFGRPGSGGSRFGR